MDYIYDAFSFSIDTMWLLSCCLLLALYCCLFVCLNVALHDTYPLSSAEARVMNSNNYLFFLDKRMALWRRVIPTLTYHDVAYGVEGGCYININVSEIHSGNCGNSTAHAQNIIFSPNRTGLFLTYLGLRRGRGDCPPSIFFVSEPITT